MEFQVGGVNIAINQISQQYENKQSWSLCSRFEEDRFRFGEYNRRSPEKDY